MRSPSSGASEQHPHFPSGDWEGFYTYSGNRRPKGEMAMTLDFSNGSISGAGSDPVGVHSWTGNYDTKAGTCQLTKIYPGSHSVFYSGYVDENGIWGKWRIIWMTGDFHIWPKKKDIQEEAEIVKESINVMEAVAV